MVFRKFCFLDEVLVIVFDFGLYFCRLGYVGEDQFKFVFLLVILLLFIFDFEIYYDSIF